MIEGIEFRSVTVRAFKAKEGPCWERNQAVIYRGPWKSVRDDDGHTYHYGARMAVCDKTYSILTDPEGPYHADIFPVPPQEVIPLEDADSFESQGTRLRHPRETKGLEYNETVDNTSSASDYGPSCCRFPQSQPKFAWNLEDDRSRADAHEHFKAAFPVG